MIGYKVRHKPTGLFYSKKGCLSKKGSIYTTKCTILNFFYGSKLCFDGYKKEDFELVEV